MELDETNKIILRRLMENARTSFSEIAKECNLSVAAVTIRFNNLKKAGIITGTTLFLDLTEGKNQFAVAITLDLLGQKYEQSVIKQMKSIPQILGCMSVIGNHNLYAAAFVRNNHEIHKIKDQIKKIKGIKEVMITTNLDRDYLFTENLLE